MLKPMLAEDFEESKLKFPLLAQPKVDGVRGLHITGRFTGRSLKPHGNEYLNNYMSDSKYAGLDGEIYVGQITSPTLCRDTTSAVNSYKGTPDFKVMCFDYLVEATLELNYMERLTLLEKRLEEIADSRLHIVETHYVTTLDSLLELEAIWLDHGYEGTIIRDPKGFYKSGRSTVREGGLLRIKRFIEEDAVVTGIVEGRKNNNVAETNELGRTERSSHQENMEPNGMVGSLLCTEVKTGMAIEVSAGSMTHEERRFYFENPQELLNKTIQFKHFNHGRKDLPRFPTYVSIRAESDKV